MKIEEIKIKNFRSLKDFHIKFSEDITCIVGENDSGKTSFIDCIRVFSSNNPYIIEKDDFYKYRIRIDDKNFKHEIEGEVCIELQLTNEIKVVKESFLTEDNIKPYTKIFYKKEYIEKQLRNLENILIEEDKNKLLKELEEEKQDNIRELAKKLSISLRSNQRVKTILENIDNKLCESDGQIEVEAHFNIIVYYLDSLTIDTPEVAIEKLFLSDIKTAIWQRVIPINSDLSKKITIKELIQTEVENLKKEKEKIFKEKIEEKLEEFLGEENLSIKIAVNLEEQPLKIDLKTQIVDKYGNEISIIKKGLGTQRRVTMALLELKLQEINDERDINIFIFDEPDAHLHIKAQRELLKLLKTYSTDKQIIITTHSPYILNLLNSSQIRVLELKKLRDGNHYTKLKSIVKHGSESDQIEKLLRDLGVENTLLFFARKLVIVEGKTEKVFIETLYSEYYSMTPYGDFIKIIEAQGITDAPRLVKVLFDELQYPKENIYLMIDADIEKRPEEETYKIIEELKNKGWSEDHIFKVGYKEIEDIFAPEDIYEAWENYVINRGKSTGPDWKLENINMVFEKCKKSDKKIRKELRPLTKGCGVKFHHADSFPKALAKYYAENIEKLPQVIKDLLEKLKEEET